jgi:hypothetical protein
MALRNRSLQKERFPYTPQLPAELNLSEGLAPNLFGYRSSEALTATGTFPHNSPVEPPAHVQPLPDRQPVKFPMADQPDCKHSQRSADTRLRQRVTRFPNRVKYFNKRNIFAVPAYRQAGMQRSTIL